MRGIILFGVLLSVFGGSVSAQTGGVYTLTQTALANGGGTASGGTYSIDATTGQPVTEKSSQSPYAVSSGFWQPVFVPTAASGSVSGRVVTANGNGIRNAIVTITDTTNGETRIVRTATFGLYRFDGLETGRTYIVTVSAKRYRFSNDSHVVSLADSVGDADFLANPR